MAAPQSAPGGQPATGAAPPAALAPFSQNWIGGDIRGLAAFAGQLRAYASKVVSVSSALDKQVAALVRAARWEGAAAKAFSSAWDKDSVAATAMASAVSNIGGIVEQLALRLATIESALEDAAAAARAHGVPVGPDGAPARAPAQARWASAYQAFYNRSMAAARQARDTAATALAQYAQAVASDTKGMTLGDTITTLDILGDMLALPAANQPFVKKRIMKVKAEEDEALAEAKNSELSVDKLVDELAADDEELARSQSALALDEAVDTDISRLLATSIGDLTAKVNQLMVRLASVGHASAPVLADGAGDETAGALAKAVDFAKDIPVIDLAAALAGTGLATYADVSSGQPLATALPEELAANALGVGVGAVAGGAAMAAIGGGLVGGAVAAGAAGVVALGVGDFTDKLFHENWAADIQSHGVVGGVAGGVANSAVATGQDIASMGKDIGHTVAHVWDDIF